ncbi:LysM peptidoglycan-binding domain-containing protein [Peribacillus sp. SCS-26]|uniref:cell division suppressor protein YneA n=1 Tax=Paraperibacillus marinus TaxID=3115295 RepID=UPI003905B3FA
MKTLWKNHTYTILFFAFIIVFSLITLHKPEQNLKSTTVTVMKGDTISEIAERYQSEELPKEAVARWIEENNDISGGLIKAGEELKIPYTLSGGSGTLASDM